MWSQSLNYQLIEHSLYQTVFIQIIESQIRATVREQRTDESLMHWISLQLNIVIPYTILRQSFMITCYR